MPGMFIVSFDHHCHMYLYETCLFQISRVGLKSHLREGLSFLEEWTPVGSFNDFETFIRPENKKM